MTIDPRVRLTSFGRRDLLAWDAIAAFARSVKAQPGPATDTRAVLEAAAARILPSDDGPGASEARVARFIERQLAGSLAPLRPAFDQLARLLDLSSARMSGKPFVSLPARDQDVLLTQLSRGALPVRGLPQEAMFRALHSLTLEGFLSDPVHGGNDGEVGWRAIGFSAPHLRKPGGGHGR